jgi:DNA polymerase III subunit delta'
MQFKDVIGQEEVKLHLVEMVQQNRLSHALLFLGKEGSGALPLAMAFAQYIVSLPPAPSSKGVIANVQESSLFGEAAIEMEIRLPSTPNEADMYMSKQSSFSKAEGMVHPDIHFTYPVVTKKAGSPPISADYITEWREFMQTYPYGNIYDWLQFIGAENKQGNITAQECNEVMRQLSLKSFESGYKILILWMPEYLGKEGNKLLKLIEEPPADTLFILVAENEGQILSTIVSRCQLIRIPSLEPAAIEKALIERNNCKPEQAHQLAGVCEGSYREALHLLQHADEDFHSLLREWLNATLKGQTIAQVKFIEEINRLGRETQKQFLRYFTHLLEQSIRLESFDGEAKDVFYDSLAATEQDFISRLNKMLSLEQKEVIAEELNKAMYYVERNANGKLLFHALTIKIFHIVKNNILISA